jgi:pyruvate kinase
LQNLKEALKQRPELTCAVMLDTKGPEVRTGKLENAKNIELVKDQILEISKIQINLATDYSFLGNTNKIACSYKNLPKTVKVGSTILIADGSIVSKVIDIVDDTLIKVQIINGASLGEKKNMNLPGIIVDLPILAEKDVDDLVNFGIKEGVDMIAASFVRNPENVNTIRKVLSDKGANILIVSKIENHEGIENFEKILEVTDAVMVARGDLGMEIPIEKVFLAQKYMIDQANFAGKPIITATQMLESMIKNPRPTRAESTDVANAVLDGSDCVMLSGETANGSYPFNAVDCMAKICIEAEQCINYKYVFETICQRSNKPLSFSEAVCCSAVKTAADLKADLIVSITETGNTALLLSKFRPYQPIISFCNNSSVIRNFNLSRGVYGYEISSYPSQDNYVEFATKHILEKGLGKKGISVVFVMGINEGKPEQNAFMKHQNI